VACSIYQEVCGIYRTAHWAIPGFIGSGLPNPSSVVKTCDPERGHGRSWNGPFINRLVHLPYCFYVQAIRNFVGAIPTLPAL